MNLFILFGVYLAVVSAQTFQVATGQYIPIKPGQKNVITFSCGNEVKVQPTCPKMNSSSIKYSILPEWISQSTPGGTISGIAPVGAKPTAITIYFVDSTGSQKAMTVVLAPEGINPNTPVFVPNGQNNQDINSNIVGSNPQPGQGQPGQTGSGQPGIAGQPGQPASTSVQPGGLNIQIGQPGQIG